MHWQTVEILWDEFDEPVALQQSWSKKGWSAHVISKPDFEHRYVPLSELTIDHGPLVRAGLIENPDSDRPDR